MCSLKSSNLATKYGKERLGPANQFIQKVDDYIRIHKLSKDLQFTSFHVKQLKVNNIDAW